MVKIEVIRKNLIWIQCKNYQDYNYVRSRVAIEESVVSDMPASTL